MHDLFSQLTRRIAVPAISACVIVTPLMAAEDFNARMESVVAALDSKQWDKALEVLQAEEKGDAKKPVFQQGALLYHHGYALLQRGMARLDAGNAKEGQEDVQLAIEKFEACASLHGEGEDLNVYQKRALLYQAMANQSLGTYGKALELYEKFLLERDQLRDAYDQGVMLVNLVICNSLGSVPNLVEAAEAFEDILDNQERWKLDNVQVMRALSALVEGHAKQGKAAELSAFLAKNRAALIKAVNHDEKAMSSLLSMAAHTSNLGIYPSSSEMLSMLPVIQEVIGKSQQVLKSPESYVGTDEFLLGLRDKRVDEIKPAGGASGDGENSSIKALELFAYNAEQGGSLEIAKTAYLMLEEHYPKSLFRDRDLSHLVRLCSVLKDDEGVIQYSKKYLSDYGQGEHMQMVRTLLVDSLYQTGSYDEVVRMYHEGLNESSDFGDDELLIAVRCAYQSARYADTLKFIDVIGEQSLDTEKAREIAYYKASSLVRMQRWKIALEAIDDFQKKYGKEGEYGELLQYEEAQCYFSLLEMDSAKKELTDLIAKKEGTKLAGDSYNLLGNIQQSMRERDQAEVSYIQALKIGKSLKNDLLIQESIFYLVSLLGQETINDFKNRETAKALPYFEEFFQTYTNSEYAAQVAVAGMAAMREAGRSAEYVNILQQAILLMSEKDRTPGLELAMDTYVWSLQDQGRTFDEVRQFMYDHHASVRFSAIARDAIARAYGKFDTKAKGKKELVRATVNDMRRRVVMADLHANYKLTELAPYVMLNLANYLSSETSNPADALPYYEAVIKRGTVREGIEAEFGIARILKASALPDQLARAQELLEDVFSRSTDDALGDNALAQIVEILAEKEAWEAVSERSKEYMANKSFDRNRGRMAYLQAYAYDKRGMVEDAIAYYGQIYATYLNSLDISAPAVERLVALTWERNKPGETAATSDRQVAYQLAHRYLSLTKEEFDSKQAGLSEKARKAWTEIEKHVDQWEKSGEIKTVEQLLEDRRRGRKSFE